MHETRVYVNGNRQVYAHKVGVHSEIPYWLFVAQSEGKVTITNYWMWSDRDGVPMHRGQHHILVHPKCTAFLGDPDSPTRRWPADGYNDLFDNCNMGDWLVQDEDGELSIWKHEDFANHHSLVDILPNPYFIDGIFR